MSKCGNYIVAFVDFKKLYDSTNRTALLSILEEFGINNERCI